MTAPIVGQVSRETYAELGIPMTDLPISGDDGVTPMIRQAFNIRGQLWERVAEMGHAGVVNSPNYTPRIANAYRHTVMHADGREALGMSRR